ncbi:hypothetical protein CDD83_7793 [Cordyceps sp. RAO-2017]|nr:hypothetical protein CDD83_7793 [Cordyceps sp. RAO-2017]
MATPAEQYDSLLPQSHQHQRQPQLPQQRQQQHQRPQTKPRSFSVRSDKTHRSGGSKSDSHETHEEKESKRLHTKADPTLAINEAEPSTVAMMTQSNHVPLRSMQHKDVWGNPITDPDKSNPTRNRWERPLDTIRGFEAAIEGAYSRKTMYRSDTESTANWSQRGAGPPPHGQPRLQQDGYYGNRPPSLRADTQYGNANPATARNSYLESQQGYGGGYNNGYGRQPQQQPPRDRGQRMHPEYQGHGRDQNVYPLPHKDRSYETVTSAVPSGNSDPAGYQTDPTSSDNSSVDRISPAKRHEPTNDYGIGFSQGQAYQSPGFAVGAGANGHYGQGLASPSTDGGHYDVGPAVPLKQSSALSRQVSPPPHDGPDQKRKSWFSRRFSKDA